MLYSKEETSDDYVEALTESIKSELDLKEIKKGQDIKGGIVNKAALFNTDRGRFFVKYAERDNAFDMFETEAWSLDRIKATEIIKVPDTIKVGKHPLGGAYHIMEYIEDLATPVNNCWNEMGKSMARLHKINHVRIEQARIKQQSVHKDLSDLEFDHCSPVYKFGTFRTIYMGPTFTIPAGTWCDTEEELALRFYLKPLFDHIEQQHSEKDFRDLWSEIQVKGDKFFGGDSKTPPSILHNDFCSINIGESSGKPVLFDPSVSFGNWEGDFTIVTMEDNFPEEFFTGYDAINPRPEDFLERQKMNVMFGHLVSFMDPVEDKEHKLEALRIARELLEADE